MVGEAAVSQLLRQNHSAARLRRKEIARTSRRSGYGTEIDQLVHHQLYSALRIRKYTILNHAGISARTFFQRVGCQQVEYIRRSVEGCVQPFTLRNDWYHAANLPSDQLL